MHWGSFLLGLLVGVLICGGGFIIIDSDWDWFD